MIKIRIKLNIRNIRATHGVSQKELARRTGLSQSYISRLSLGIKSPTLDVVAKIATALNVCPFKLMEVTNSDKYTLLLFLILFL